MLMANPKCLGEGVEWARYILPHLAYQNVNNAPFTIKMSRQKNLQKQFDLCFCYFFHIMGYHKTMLMANQNVWGGCGMGSLYVASPSLSKRQQCTIHH